MLVCVCVFVFVCVCVCVCVCVYVCVTCHREIKPAPSVQRFCVYKKIFFSEMQCPLKVGLPVVV